MAKKTHTRRKRKTSDGKKKRRQARSPNPRRLLIAALMISGIALSPTLFNDFISLDDDNFILSNPVVQDAQIDKAFTRQLFSPHYKPLVYLSWIIETSIFGNSAFVLHFTNWLLHLINVGLIFLCFRHIARFWMITAPHELWVAFFSAVLFGVHPLHVESVAWAIERKDVMFTCFYLAGLLNYLRFLDGRQRKYLLLAGGFYILSLLSKSMGISLVGVAFLIDWASGRRDWKQMVLDKWIFVFGIVLALFAYGFLYQPSNAKPVVATLGAGAAAPPENLSDAPGALQQLYIANFRYLFFLLHNLFPVRLSLVYPRELLLGLAGGGIHLLFLVTAGIWALPFMLKKYKHIFLTGLAFFTLTIAPVLLEEGPGTNFGSDRYSYVPGVGVMFILIVMLLRGLPQSMGKHLTAGRLTLGTLAVVFAAGSFGQALKWDGGTQLYDQAIRNYPENWVALHLRGNAREDIDRDGAIADYTKSLEINPSKEQVWFSRGTLFLNMGRLQEAVDDFTRTLELDPVYWKAWVNRGNALRDLGRNREAITDYNVVLEGQPQAAADGDIMIRHQAQIIKALNNRGVAYLNLGQIQNALNDFNRVLELDPDYTLAMINRAAVYINQAVQQYDNAVADYTRCLQLDPENVQARYFRGYALQKLGRYEEGLADVDVAIRQRPNNGMYHYTRAQILRSLGRIQQSVQAAQQARSLGYNVPAQYLAQ